ncbi:MAG: glycosyltransferase family 9 protein, partial [Chloroflexi bacterium]|nr:glycosyltransferase family 9 protein [Chloroflexota bacterium]
METSVARSGEAQPTIQIPIRKIAIVRALHLGDLLLAVPAFRALRKRFPEAEITLIGLPWAKEFVRRFSAYLDRWVQFPGFPGMLEVEVDWSRTRDFLKSSRAYGYDLAIQMHGDGSVSNKFTALLGARLTAGYRRPDLPSPRLTHTLPYPEGMKEVLKHLRLVEALGARYGDAGTEFPLYPYDFDELRQLPGAKELEGQNPIVAIHAGARPPARRWYPERFASVADWLVAEHQATVVLCGGPGEEYLSQAVPERMRA